MKKKTNNKRTSKIQNKKNNNKVVVTKKVNHIKEKNKKDIPLSIKWIFRAIGLLSFALVVSFISIIYYQKYVINQTCFNFYLEVKDRDLKEKILTNDEIHECIDGVCFDFNTGYTIWKGVGGYIGEDRKMQSDDTFIIRINNIDTDTANKISRALVDAVNSTACMIEENRSKAWLYSCN